MTANTNIVLYAGEPQTCSALERALRTSGYGFQTMKAPGASWHDVLRATPVGVVVDRTTLASLDNGSLARIQNAHIQLALAFHGSNTGTLSDAVRHEMSAFIELPIDQVRFDVQIQRLIETARLRRELGLLREQSHKDAQAFDAMLSERTAERNEAENRALALSRRLADLDRLKSNLITIISHEFKTPLHLASGYASLLADESSGKLSAEQKSAIDVMMRQLNRLQAKLQDIERIAQLEMGLSPDTSEAVDVAVILRREIEGFEEAFARRKLHAAIDIPNSLPLLQGNQDFLADVFRRLIDNAIHYNKEGGKVGVSANVGKATNGMSGIVVEVSDSGRGIAPELVPHIFDRFGEFRDIEHHSSRQSGLGLGLAICRHLVEMHEGKISVESTPGKGSVFRVFLPVHAAR